jgi:hypothetical protein
MTMLNVRIATKGKEINMEFETMPEYTNTTQDAPVMMTLLERIIKTKAIRRKNRV